MKRALRTALLSFAAAFTFVPPADAQTVTEPAIKAAFLYKFLGYVEWPSQAMSPDGAYVIAVAGADEVAGELERIVAGRSINGHRVTVRRVREGDSPGRVHVLFVGRGQGNPRELIRAVQRQGVLTVTDAERGLEQGSVVNLVTLEDHVGFEISLDAAERAGLNISSRMLAVARRVVPKAAPT
jgi:hypothetical protein